jgi:hypothetical protein
MPGKPIKRNHKIGLEVGGDRIAGAVVQQQGRGIKLVDAVCLYNDTPGKKFSTEQIGQFVEDHQLIGRDMVLVLDDPSLYLKQLAVPKSLMEKSDNELKWYLEQFLPYPVARAAQSHYDCGVEFGAGDLIIVGVVFREVVDAIIKALQEAGASISKIDILPFTLGRLYNANYDVPDDGCTGLFDFNNDHGYGTVMKGTEIMTARRFSLHRSDGGSFAKAVEDTLRSFEIQFPQEIVDRVYVTARSPINHAGEELIRKSSCVEVEKIDPGRRIEIKDINDEVLRHATTAIGAALEDTRYE